MRNVFDLTKELATLRLLASAFSAEDTFTSKDYEKLVGNSKKNYYVMSTLRDNGFVEVDRVEEYEREFDEPRHQFVIYFNGEVVKNLHYCWSKTSAENTIKNLEWWSPKYKNGIFEIKEETVTTFSCTRNFYKINTDRVNSAMSNIPHELEKAERHLTCNLNETKERLERLTHLSEQLTTLKTML